MPASTRHGRGPEVPSDLNKWGRANQVSFDPAKESVHRVPHPAAP